MYIRFHYNAETKCELVDCENDSMTDHAQMTYCCLKYCQFSGNANNELLFYREMTTI